MVEWITNTMSALGYWGIGLLMFLENLFPPIPSELIMPLAGFTVSKGQMNFQYAVLAGVLGALLGALPWYYAGKLVGEERLAAIADRYGKWFGISGADIDKANRWFYRHGNKAVLLGRLVPGIRTLISLPAGISEMRLAPFLVYSTIGTTIWTTILTYAGYLLGEHYDRVDDYLAPVSKIVLGGLIVALGVWLVRRKQTQRLK
ncbi:DedA family protein [Phormidesmis priestleyi ULC007]|uniref:DedA family protein n=1 Tax=Phormidesmis priestleyi ULC007 TaxID=1920490 RepID=A0A2T1D4V8_9CYAN|nr:DedA family protein [Phormidesmis priestleyi]PSB15518.1 DedA family protein [Phormidesmis priestleyi ULC007]PZO46383.1 MAG: DedA family protein [Phormidesmis priestleyi]